MLTLSHEWGVAIWAQDHKSEITPPPVMFLGRRSTASTPHTIILAELAVPPMMVDAFFQTMNYINHLQTILS